MYRFDINKNLQKINNSIKVKQITDVNKSTFDTKKLEKEKSNEHTNINNNSFEMYEGIISNEKCLFIKSEDMYQIINITMNEGKIKFIPGKEYKKNKIKRLKFIGKYNILK